MKNPGTIIKLPDERICIVYKDQPLAESEGKVIMHLVDGEYNLIKDENGRKKIIIKNVEEYNKYMQASFKIGYVD